VKTTRLRVTLLDVEPAVVRVVDVPEPSTLPELHELLQAALGWTDSHLHQFVTGDATYAMPDLDDWGDDQQDETGVRLRQLPPRFTYLYDFGDGWEHDVEVLGPGEEQPGCPYGEGACPPEDCGGPSGYANLLAALADPDHEEHDHLREWAGELAPFDQIAADDLVRRTVGTVPESVLLVFDLVGGGVKLTPGGRLPRVFVRRVQEERPHWCPWGKPASVEEDLFALAALHEVLRKVGLLRLRNGVLLKTKAAGDDLEVLRRLRSWFDPQSFEAILADRAVAALIAWGPMTGDELASRVHPMLGHRWSRGGQPLTEPDTRTQLSRISSVLCGLDLVVKPDWSIWRAGPSARSLLPGATALAELLTRTPESVEDA